MAVGFFSLAAIYPPTTRRRTPRAVPPRPIDRCHFETYMPMPANSARTPIMSNANDVFISCAVSKSPISILRYQSNSRVRIRDDGLEISEGIEARVSVLVLRVQVEFLA